MLHRNSQSGRRTHAVVIALTFFHCTISLADQPGSQVGQWTGWRGNDRTAVIPATNWPDSLTGEAIAPVFRVPLGPGYSGPIVSQKHIYVTETVGKKDEVVKAIDRETGDVVWEVRWAGAVSVPFFAASNGSWIRSTPTFDGERLYVAGMRDVLVCLDAGSGEEIWRVDFADKLKTPLQSFGFVCSPLIDGDRLFVQFGGGLACLNRRSGEIEWRSLEDRGGMMGGAFSSPVIATLAGTRQLVVQTRSKLAGVDPDTGQELWSQEIPSFRGMNILTPLVVGDRVFTSSYGGGSFLFEISRTDNSFQIREVWKNRTEGYMSSPVLIGESIYLHLRNQRFTCLDAATGETRWTSRPFGKYWSMVASGTTLIVLDERGELLLIDASPEEFRLIDRREISTDETWAHIAVAGEQVFVRELNALAVYDWKSPGSGTRSDSR